MLVLRSNKALKLVAHLFHIAVNLAQVASIVVVHWPEVRELLHLLEFLYSNDFVALFIESFILA